MSLEEDTKIYGRKGAVLKYINEQLPSVPIEPFILVPIGEDYGPYIEDAQKFEDFFVRSSSPVEDGKHSFAGLFETINYHKNTPFDGNAAADKILKSALDNEAVEYAQIHGIELTKEMGLVLHKNSDSDVNWGMLRHPHCPGLLFIMGKVISHNMTYNYVFDEKAGKAFDVGDFHESQICGKDATEEGLDVDILIAINNYRTIESLPEFQKNYTYHMEFGTDPFSVYQFRPFRKVEIPTWKIEKKNISKNDLKCSICFGITPKEGIELTAVGALVPRGRNKLEDYYRENKDKLPYDDLVEKIMELSDFNQYERCYAEQLATLPLDVTGYVTTECYERAIAELNRAAVKSQTCLLQENIHFYHAKDIDLLFPNARAYFAEYGAQFLSHNSFRAMQSYEFAMTGSESTDRIFNSEAIKTGCKVRVFSDGITGMIKKV